MRARHLLLSLFAAALVSPSIASAQFSMGGPTGKSMIALYPDVSKELKLSGDQKKQMQAAMSALSAAGNDPQSMMSMGMNLNNMTEEVDAKVLVPLTPEQLTRLDELWVQYNGPKVLTKKPVADKLQLTEDQSAQIKTIWEDFSKTYMDDIQHPMSRMSASKKKRKESDAATLALLTADQAKAFEEMQGKKFKFQMKNDY